VASSGSDSSGAQRRPLIGLTTYLEPARYGVWSQETALLPRAYVDVVARVGGWPVLLPPVADLDASVLGALDGLVLSGGGDVDPSRYGADRHPATGGTSVVRDAAEEALLQAALSADVPVLGVCRGMQVLNVALGGTLYRDIAEYPLAHKHTYYPDLPFDLRPHPVQVAEDSRLAEALGQPLVDVNSLHHQAVREVAPALRAVAHAPDGLVEAVEVRDHPFALAVQWHPECLPDAPEMRRLFEAFVRAAAERR
jgi:putative glutamine amidotransferase